MRETLHFVRRVAECPDMGAEELKDAVDMGIDAIDRASKDGTPPDDQTLADVTQATGKALFRFLSRDRSQDDT